MNLIQPIVYLHLDYHGKLVQKKKRVKLEVLINNDMLLMVEKGIRGGIVHAMHRYAKTDNKYLKIHDENISHVLSYLMYLDGINFYAWSMSQKLPANGFK